MQVNLLTIYLACDVMPPTNWKGTNKYAASLGDKTPTGKDGKPSLKLAGGGQFLKEIMEKHIESIRIFAKVISETLSPVLKIVSEALRDFDKIVYSLAQNDFLNQFGYLPGSRKTKRLRKKRKQIVMNWYINRLKTGWL